MGILEKAAQRWQRLKDEEWQKINDPVRGYVYFRNNYVNTYDEAHMVGEGPLPMPQGAYNWSLAMWLTMMARDAAILPPGTAATSAISKSRRMVCSWEHAAFCSWALLTKKNIRIWVQSKTYDDAKDMVSYKSDSSVQGRLQWIFSHMLHHQHQSPWLIEKAGVAALEGELRLANGSGAKAAASGGPKGKDKMRQYGPYIWWCSEYEHEWTVAEQRDAYTSALSCCRLILLESTPNGKKHLYQLLYPEIDATDKDKTWRLAA